MCHNIHEFAHLSMDMYSSRPLGNWTHRVACRSASTTCPNIRTTQCTSYASFLWTLCVISCSIPFQVWWRSEAQATTVFPLYGRVDSRKKSLHPLPDQFLSPSPKLGFLVMLSDVVLEYVDLASTEISLSTSKLESFTMFCSPLGTSPAFASNDREEY